MSSNASFSLAPISPLSQLSPSRAGAVVGWEGDPKAPGGFPCSVGRRSGVWGRARGAQPGGGRVVALLLSTRPISLGEEGFGEGGGRGLSAPGPDAIPTHGASGAAGEVGAAVPRRGLGALGAVGSGPPRCRGQNRAAVTRCLRLLPCSASCNRRAGCDRPRPWLCARRPHR